MRAGLDPRGMSGGAAPANRRSALTLRRAVLARAIEAEVIPRLVLAHREAPVRVAPLAGLSAALPTAQHVEQLTSLVLTSEQPAATGFVEAMRDTGMSFDSLYLDLLTPTARRLGDLWEDDLCDFGEVTLGLLRLHSVLRAIGPTFMGIVRHRPAAPTALLVQMPGEQHGFGLAMVIQFFRRAGWQVCSEPVPDSAALRSIVASQPFGIVGISVACSQGIERVAAEIRSVRLAARHGAVGIMVGGPPFLEDPNLAQAIGADATAIDGLQAVQQAEYLVALMAAER
jgi:methanogenic corrinoid protein MtbC1